MSDYEEMDSGLFGARISRCEAVKWIIDRREGLLSFTFQPIELKTNFGRDLAELY
jgi:hypothetical protein